MQTIEEVIDKIDIYTLGRTKSQRCQISNGELFDLCKEIRKINKKQLEEIQALKNRCAVSTSGLLCPFCNFECSKRSHDFDDELNEIEEE